MAAIKKRPGWLKYLRIHNQNIREAMGEFMGTFLLTTFCKGASVQLNLMGNDSLLRFNMVTGFAVMLSLYMCGGVSGGCFNPAVSYTMCLTGRMLWRRLIFHIVGQFLGAFVAAFVVYGVYYEAIDNYDGGERTVFGPKGTAHFFASFPQPYLSTLGGFVDQIVGTSMLILPVLAIIDKNNLAPPSWFVPLPVGLSVAATGGAFGLNMGYPINPAYDLGPRTMLVCTGWGTEVFSFRGYNWFWTPIAGPIVGATASCLLYWTFIQLHWPDKEVKAEEIDYDNADPNKYIMSKGQESDNYEHAKPSRYKEITQF